MNVGLAIGALLVSVGWMCPPSAHFPEEPMVAVPFMAGVVVVTTGTADGIT